MVSAGEAAGAAVAIAVDAAVAGVAPRGASIDEMGAGTGTAGGAVAIGVADAGSERTAWVSAASLDTLDRAGGAGVVPVLDAT